MAKDGKVNSFREKILIIPVMLAIYDVVIANVSYGLALWMRFDFRMSSIPVAYMHGWLYFTPVFGVLTLVVCLGLRLYGSIWKYASYNEVLRGFAAAFILGVLHVVGTVCITVRMPVSYYIMGWIIMCILLIGIRLSYRAARLLLQNIKRNDGSFERILIIGGGEAGRLLIRDIMDAERKKGNVICIADDDPAKQGKALAGIPIKGTVGEVPEMVSEYNIDRVIISIPSADDDERNEIVRKIKGCGCVISTMPRLSELVDSTVNMRMMREVRIEDLLGRDSICIDNNQIREIIMNRTVLVTGGGGSIGSELCRQIASFGPERLIIFDVYENGAYEVQQEIIRKYPYLKLHVIIGSVWDKRTITGVMEQFAPDMVVHAAAHKHVPLMETVPYEAIKNNVFGTYFCAKAAADCGVKRFLLISTDKAVNPTNIMGASKRICEMVIESMNRECGTDYFAVRFGNVLGSNGSVIPLFKKQIEAGGPVTVTHPEITRFFMTIPEAVGLILQASAYAQGGEIFVLDMGKPVKIDDLARNLIELSGLVPDVNIKIEYTGLRPGEKLYEELLMAEEGLGKTDNDLIFIGGQSELPEDFSERMTELWNAAENNSSDIKELVRKVVSTYLPGRDN